jgi:hypothetical protein
VLKNSNSEIAFVLGELRAAMADLVQSANIAVCHMVLRSKLSAAISDAENVERIAESLRIVVVAEIEKDEQAILVPVAQVETGQREIAIAIPVSTH